MSEVLVLKMLTVVVRLKVVHFLQSGITNIVGIKSREPIWLSLCCPSVLLTAWMATLTTIIDNLERNMGGWLLYTGVYRSLRYLEARHRLDDIVLRGYRIFCRAQINGFNVESPAVVEPRNRRRHSLNRLRWVLLLGYCFISRWRLQI